LYSSSVTRPQYNGAGSDASDEDEDDFAAPRKAKTGAGAGSKIKGGSRPKAPLQSIDAAESSEDGYSSSSAPRKRRKPHTSTSVSAPVSASTSDVRISSCGQKIPNYAEDGGYQSDEFLEDDDAALEPVDNGPVESTGDTAALRNE